MRIFIVILHKCSSDYLFRSSGGWQPSHDHHWDQHGWTTGCPSDHHGTALTEILFLFWPLERKLCMTAQSWTLVTMTTLQGLSRLQSLCLNGPELNRVKPCPLVFSQNPGNHRLQRQQCESNLLRSYATSAWFLRSRLIDFQVQKEIPVLARQLMTRMKTLFLNLKTVLLC